MKHSVLILLLTLYCSLANAQTGVIYNFTFKIEDELVTQMKAQNKDNKILNLATVEDMPKELSDTLVLISENMLGDYLGNNIVSMVPKEKLLMAALPEHLLYLPANTFKKAVKTFDSLNVFIDIDCSITAKGGLRITLANNSYSKVKPKLNLTIKIFNKEKELIETKEVVLKDFEKLRSRSFDKTYGIRGLGQNTDRMTESETINSDDVLRMYVSALVAALQK
jgi:hypothetical protein